MTRSDWTELACAVSLGTLPGMEILRERGTDVRIARVPCPETGTAIVKCWNRPTWRGTLRRLSRSNIGYREAEALRRLQTAPQAAPAPYAYLHFPRRGAAHTEALISSDLGPCADSTEAFKHLLQHDPPAADAFEATLIQTTAAMVRQGLLDPDHRLPNFVVTPENHLVRIDFELCIPVRSVAAHPRLLGDMLGVLIGSHAFAVQPRVDRTAAFARRLADTLHPAPSAWDRANRKVQAMLDRQRQQSGIDTQLTLPRLSP